MAHSRGRSPAPRSAIGAVSKKSARLPLASTSHTRVRWPRLGGQPGQGGGDRGLADAALTGDEDQFAVEQVDQAPASSPPARSADGGAEADPAVLAAGVELDIGHPGRTGRRPGGLGGRSARARPARRPAPSRSGPPASSASVPSASSTSISLGVWVTPMRTSTSGFSLRAMRTSPW